MDGLAESWWVLAVGALGWALAVYGLLRSRRLEAGRAELHQTRERVERSQMWRLLLLESLPLGFLEYDAEGVILEVNERFGMMVGQPKESLAGRRVEESLPGLEGIVPHVVGVLELDRILQPATGDPVWVRLQISPIAQVSGRIHGGLVLVSDITEHKEHEQEQEQLGKRLTRIANEWQATFDAVDSPILILDKEGRIRRMNRAAMELTGKPFTASLGRTLEEVGDAEPWSSLRTLVDRVQEGEAAQTLQVRDDHWSGRSWDLTANRARHPIATTAFILIARETTDLVALQRSVQHSELMSAMGALVAGVAHEVRNPLFGISATLDAFEARLGTENPSHRFIEVLRAEVQRMGNLMTELLDYGKPIELRPSMETLRSVILEAIEHCETLALQADVEVKVDFAEALPPIRMDRHHMVQVFKNLVANAIQHSTRHGEVRVRLEAAADGPQCFSVRDHGEGFTERSLERIFEPFYSERRGGVGLGLSIVQRFVLEQGGSVRAFNHPEGGAVVEVTLPVHEETSCPATDRPATGSPATEGPDSGRSVPNPDPFVEPSHLEVAPEIEAGTRLSQGPLWTESS